MQKISYIFFPSIIKSYYKGVGLRVDDTVITLSGLEGIKTHSYKAYKKHIKFTEVELKFNNDLEIYFGLEAVSRSLDFIKISPIRILLATFNSNYDNCATVFSAMINERFKTPQELFKYIKDKQNE